MIRMLFGCLLFVVGTHCRADVILLINPSSQTVPFGSQVSFDVDISGLGGGTALGTYDINLGFDPTALSYESTTFGNQVDISGLGDIQFVSPGIGTVELFELSLDSASELNSLQAPAFSLATLTFNTLAPEANSPVTLSLNALGDAYGNSISADPDSGSVSVIASTSPVPEPSSLLLVLGAVPAYAVWRMSCRQKQA